MITAIIQARATSSRFPRKVLQLLKDKKTVLEYTIKRVKRSNEIDQIIVATTTNYEDDDISQLCSKIGVSHYRGSERDVLDRYYQTAKISGSNVIVRITSDCPLIDPELIDKALKKFNSETSPYLCFNYVGEWEGFPDGFDVEIFTFGALENAWKVTKDERDREHVTRYFRENLKTLRMDIDVPDNYLCDLKHLHLSLDSESDFVLIKEIINNLKDDFTYLDVLSFLNDNSSLLLKNSVLENDILFNGKGQELYEVAKGLIPGGTQLLSKRPEMFLPDNWPSYYRKANGIEITTLDGIKLKDFSYMGIGACVLGYSHPDVNNEIHKCINRGSTSTLNCPNEVKLTQLLCEIHPWASMARYTRSGGEACAVAVRIARTYTKKDKIAVCGYHGWHDWYLAANLSDDKSLDGHLIKGLSPNGVPQGLRGSVLTFHYNMIDELEGLIEKNRDIGTIIMEPCRGQKPKSKFLERVREIADENGIILIFDEITSGFRINSGGIHLEFGVIPDIAIFGKAISNGYPLGVILGKLNVMEAAQDTFISSTHWTEDIGFTAGLSTIKYYIKNGVADHLREVGNYFQDGLKELAEKHNIKLLVDGLPSLTTFTFNYENGQEIKTLYIQLMLERRILAKNALYLSYAHKKYDIDYYLKNIDEVFGLLNKYINNDLVNKMLKGPVAHSGFKRLT